MKFKGFFMKRFILIHFAFLTLLLSSIEEVKAMEPSCNGSLTETFIDITVFGCPYRVRLCVECFATPMGNSARILIMNYWELNPNCQHIPPKTTEEIVAEIENKILEPATLSQICQNLLAPPCDGNHYIWINLATPVCWKKFWYEIDEEQYLIRGSCLDGITCDFHIKVCWEQGVMKIDTLFGPEYSPGVWGCSEDYLEPVDPPIGFESECYFIHTKCSQ
jgi:hypothetical protein